MKTKYVCCVRIIFTLMLQDALYAGYVRDMEKWRGSASQRTGSPGASSIAVFRPETVHLPGEVKPWKKQHTLPPAVVPAKADPFGFLGDDSWGSSPPRKQLGDPRAARSTDSTLTDDLQVENVSPRTSVDQYPPPRRHQPEAWNAMHDHAPSRHQQPQPRHLEQQLLAQHASQMRGRSPTMHERMMATLPGEARPHILQNAPRNPLHAPSAQPTAPSTLSSTTSSRRNPLPARQSRWMDLHLQAQAQQAVRSGQQAPGGDVVPPGWPMGPTSNPLFPPYAGGDQGGQGSSGAGNAQSNPLSRRRKSDGQ